MARKADGEVWIKTNLDNSQAQKELDKLTASIEAQEKTLTELKKKRDETKEQGVFSALELDKEKQKLQELKSELDKLKIAAKDGTLSAELRAEANAAIPEATVKWKEQAERVKLLQAEYSKIDAAAEKYNKKIEEVTAKIEEQKEKAGELAEQLINGQKNAAKLSPAFDRAGKRINRLSKRVKELVKSALLFSVLTKSLNMFKEWTKDIVMLNEDARKSVAQLKGALQTLAQPLIESAIPAFTTFVNALTKAVAVLARFVAAIFGTTIEEASESAEALYNEKEAIEGLGNAAKKTAGQLAAFDEINQLGTQNSALYIEPDFSAADLSNLPQKLQEWIVAVETKIQEIKFSWDKGEILKNKDAWIVALTGILGAVIGGIFGGFTGSIISLIVGLLLGITACDFKDKLQNPDKANDLFIVALTSILGAVLGGKFGGLPGAAIGLLLGAVISFVSLKFKKGSAKNWDKNDTIIVALSAILGAVLGATFGRFTGAIIGLLLSAGISIVAIEFSEGNYDKQATIAGLRVVLFAILGAVMGSVFGGMTGLGPIGSIIGLILGLGVGFASVRFDDKMSQNIKAQAGKGLLVVLTTIIGAIIGAILGAGVFGGIVGGLISLAFGLLITFDDVQYDDSILRKGGGGISSGTGAGRTGRISQTFSDIPALATGAVIPPNREFLAVLGDQRSGNNLEAPESLIRKIVREEAGGMNSELLEQILQAIKAGRVIQVDKRVLGKTAAEGINDLTKQTGKPVLLY